MSTLSKAIEIAASAHALQLDKAGQPYILHPLRVMLAQADDVHRIVAVLHDTIEDTAVTISELRLEKFPDEVVDAVAAISKREREWYVDYMARLETNPIAVRVKIADIEDNLSRMGGIADEETRIRLEKKYQLALARLRAVAK